MKKTLSLSALAFVGTTIFLGTAHAQMMDAMPADAMPADAMPADAMPADAMPADAMPADAMPADAMSADAMTPEMQMTGMMDSSMMTSDGDKQYLMDTAEGSVYDGATAELAVQKAQSKSVQRYALRLMDDHNRLNKMLLMQANKRGVVLPLMMKSEDQTKLQSLMIAPAGSDFDMAYLKEAMDINADDVRTGNEAIKASKDAQFRSLMREYVATEQKHLDMASAISAGLMREMGLMNKGMMTK